MKHAARAWTAALAFAAAPVAAAPHASGVIERTPPAAQSAPGGSGGAAAPLVAPDAAPPSATPALLAVVIDDLGASPAALRRVLALPAPVACAVLPHAAHARDAARLATAAGREVLVHLPMRAPGNARSSPFLLDVGMDADAISDRLREARQAVPGAVGVNNHQGSTLTAQAAPMAALMQALAGTGLYFLDSRTTAASVAAQHAARAGVPVLERQVFLDHEPGAAAVRAQWRAALTRARHDGQALAIGHPHATTLAVLAQELPHAGAAGVTLVPPSALLGNH